MAKQDGQVGCSKITVKQGCRYDRQTGRANGKVKYDDQARQANLKVKLDGRKEWPKRVPKSGDQMRKQIRMVIGQAGHGKVWLTENVYSCKLGSVTGNSLISGKLVNSKII